MRNNDIANGGLLRIAQRDAYAAGVDGDAVIDEREVTKYRDIHPGKIYLFTILKDLSLNSKIYGLDLRETEDTKKNEPA